MPIHNNKHNHAMAPPRARYFISIILLSFFSFFFSLAKGSTAVSFYQLLGGREAEISNIILNLRLPRTLTAFTCGGLLALAGSLMQILLENPLADPYVLGVSGGAAIGTLILMFLGISSQWFLLGAWGGSLVSVIFILLFARNHAWQTHSLLLIGIALASGCSAAISFLLLMSPASNLHNMMFWLTGDLNDTQMPIFGIIVLCIGFCLCFVLAPGLNLLARGEKAASALGLETFRYRVLLYLLSSFFTATAVTLAGCIGFIGLIIPHLTRRLVGFNHTISLPAAVLLGGTLLTLADTFARSLFAPIQLPVGILIALIGVPTFIGLLHAKYS